MICLVIIRIGCVSGVAESFSCLPSRKTSMSTFFDSSMSWRKSRTSAGSSTFFPSILMMTSSSLKPAFAAGLSGSTSRMRAPFSPLSERMTPNRIPLPGKIQEWERCGRSELESSSESDWVRATPASTKIASMGIKISKNFFILPPVSNNLDAGTLRLVLREPGTYT